ncbi:hypothetical protein ACSBR1_028121 [Camellia fascicularis]
MSSTAFLGDMLCTCFNSVGFNWLAFPAAIELEMVVVDRLANILKLSPSPSCSQALVVVLYKGPLVSQSSVPSLQLETVLSRSWVFIILVNSLFTALIRLILLRTQRPIFWILPLQVVLQLLQRLRSLSKTMFKFQ